MKRLKKIGIIKIAVLLMMNIIIIAILVSCKHKNDNSIIETTEGYEETTNIETTEKENYDEKEDETVTPEKTEVSNYEKGEDVSINDLKVQLENNNYNFEQTKTIEIQDQASIYALINKYNSLSSSYVPSDLVYPDVLFSFSGNDQKRQMRKEAAQALERLFEAAKKESIELAAVSGYRSFERQQTIYAGNVKRMGETEANKVSAKPGQSEHQSGLAMDVSSHSAGYNLVDSFGETNEGKWLAKNAHLYGFTIRYKKDKTDITKYSYEPWHIRYLGKELARYLYENNLTLEEFYQQ